MSLDYLALYGKSFQIKVITALLTDKSFLAQVVDILDSSHFESDSSKLIVDIIKNYYLTYKSCPTLDVFKKALAEQDSELSKLSLTEHLSECSKYKNTEDMQYVKDEFSNFCINQNIKNAILKSVEYLKDGKYDSIKKVIDDASKAGKNVDYGHIYHLQVEDRIIKNPRLRTLPTEWPIINEIIDGGLGEGDLGVLIGSAGSGKSWCLTSIGYHALTLNKNVIHITMELNENYTAKRYDSKLTGIPSEDLKYHIDELKDKITTHVKGKLIVKYYPTKSVSISTIRALISQIKANMFEPDLIIVDYADLLKVEDMHSLKGGSYSEMGSIYESLRGLAGELKIPIWTASQAHRSSQEEEIITGQHVAESYKKIMVADFIVSVARKTEDKLSNTARWYIIKNRYGKDGQTFPSKMDVSTGAIEIYKPDSIQGARTKREMKSGEAKLQNIANQRYKDFSHKDLSNEFEDAQ